MRPITSFTKMLLAFIFNLARYASASNATASDVLRCTGKKLSDGQFFFNMTYDLKEGVDDCETQWVINGRVAGIADADGYTECMPPLLKATADTAILQTCHEKLECLLICPSASINKKEPCSCLQDITSPTTLPEVGSPDWSVGVWIGVSASVILLVSVIVIIVLWKKKYKVTSHGQTARFEEEENI